MFTLPVNRDSSVNLSVPGKISVPRTWKLTVQFQTGIIVNFGDWIAGDQTDLYNDPEFTDPEFTFELLVNNQVLASHSIGPSQYTINVEIDDTDQPTIQSIIVRLATRKAKRPGIKDLHAVVRVSFGLEDLMVRDFKPFQYHNAETGKVNAGSMLIGQTGDLVLNLTTPIYTWLLSNKEIFWTN
jgi:hypothetical protein